MNAQTLCLLISQSTRYNHFSVSDLLHRAIFIYFSVKISHLASLCLLNPSPFRQSIVCYSTGYEPGADEFPTQRIAGYILVLKGIVCKGLGRDVSIRLLTLSLLRL